jgi:hypothetical protein
MVRPLNAVPARKTLQFRRGNERAAEEKGCAIHAEASRTDPGAPIGKALVLECPAGEA